jgi:dienelactone hydrolase
VKAPVFWLALLAGGAAHAQSSWDLEALAKVPATRPAEGFESSGLRAVYYDGPGWKGKPSTYFAWIGVPPGAQKVPGMVLVHGGGGTAFADWAKLWVERGYAAIAMDLCGAVPRKAGGKGPWERHASGGPPGWGGFDQIDQPERDQWTWQAVAGVVLGHTLLRSLPEVDPERTGVTGISWGGYLTCISASVDARFKFAAPVYGCGFLGEDSTWLDTFAKMGPEKAGKWLKLWDPSMYLERASMPFLWLNGTNDFAYPMGSHQKSSRLPKTERTLAIRVRMPHAHGGPGEKPEEIRVYADALFKGGVPPARILKQGKGPEGLWADFESKSRIVRAELCFTKDAGKWQKRNWETAPGVLEGARASAAIPEGATAAYLNLVDERGLVVSTEWVPAP